LHWTGIDQNWNYQCAWCHSTNLRKNYDRATRSFNTEWSEINVGCEACHGPASNHIAWASKEKRAENFTEQSVGFDLSFDERKTSRWTMGPAGTAIRSQRHATAKEVQVCAGCHARRGQFSDAPSDVRRYFDAFRTAQLEQDLYHVDGQQRDEVFEFAPFLQSKMHAAGVVCSDCHNPHSGKLRMSGNAVCSQCHAPAQFDTPAHHHHTAASRGAECTSCHMPTTVYMGVHARHDHSIRIPRPDRTHVLGTPNACNQCHADKSAQWAANAIKNWYPSPKPGAQTFAEAFDLGDRGAIGAQSALIAVVQDDSLSGIVRSSAIMRLGRFPSHQVLGVIASSLKVNDPDVRLAAIAALSSTDAATRRTLLVPLLKDVIRVVRMNAAHQLAGDAEQGLSPEDLQLLERGLTEYVAAQLFSAERPESHANLGALYLRRGMIDRARSAFLEALQLDPMFAPAAISLADLERASGDERAGQQVLISSLQRNPKSGELLHALGLSLVRQKRLAEAIEKLREAATLAPEVARFSYVLAVATHGAGRIGEAVDILKAALVRNPHDRDLLTGLISYEVEAGDVQSAVSRAELLGKLEPDRADIQRFIARLKRDTR
jgi:predicted CXXCH cytochrome family protein